MMGRQTGDQSQLFYLFNLEGRIPANDLLRRIDPVVTRVLADLHCLWPIVFSNSGFRCQALHDHPCRAHCSLRGRGVPSA
jgi:hypothetical protein